MLFIYENLSSRMQAFFLTLIYRLQKVTHHEKNSDEDRRDNNYS